MQRSVYRQFGKRIFDLTIAAPLLVALAPLLALVALLIRIVMGRGVLFKQQRPGLLGKPFILYKFRTMADLHDRDGKPLPDHERVSRLGLWLRRLSIDELPQLWNVVRGDLSLVGPRPLLPQYVMRCNPEQRRRYEAIPGITGWAQVNGRNSVTWEEKFKLDVWYVDNMSFWLDLKILWKTVWIVFSQAGIAAKGHVTMPEFMGTPQSSLSTSAPTDADDDAIKLEPQVAEPVHELVGVHRQSRSIGGSEQQNRHSPGYDLEDRGEDRTRGEVLASRKPR